MLNQQPHSAKSGNAIKHKKETLEKFAYSNNQQLFQNNKIDLQRFINNNYEKYCQLLDKLENIKQVVKLKKDHVSQISYVKPKANICVPNESIKKQIEIKQQNNCSLKQQLEILQEQTKKQDFFLEYQEICKQVEQLRIQNDQLSTKK